MSNIAPFRIGWLVEMLAVSPNTGRLWFFSMRRLDGCAPTLTLTKKRFAGAGEVCARASERAAINKTVEMARILLVFVIVLLVNGGLSELTDGTARCVCFRAA